MCVVVNMNVIKQKRKELGISQRELSEKLGTSQQTISRIEKSDVENIPSSLLIKLADIFQIPVDFLIRGDKSDLFSTKGEEMWEIYKQLDEENRTTLIMLGRRLSETQAENMVIRVIKIAICDDEKCFIDAIEKMLKTYAEKNGQDFLIKKYTKPLQLMEALKEEFQIFFLDIEMPAMDGLELVDVIRKHDEKSIVLFVSSHNELVGVGYKYDVQNFITKPITQIQINCEMNRALRKLNTYEQRYIAVKNEKGYFKLFLSDIEYIETVNRKVLFHLRNGEQEDGYFKMRDLEERLEPFFFVRCHNGIIVNVDCIESLHDLTIKLYSGDKIYITRSRKQNLMKKMAERGGCI